MEDGGKRERDITGVSRGGGSVYGICGCVMYAVYEGTRGVYLDTYSFFPIFVFTSSRSSFRVDMWCISWGMSRRPSNWRFSESAAKSELER